MPVVYHPGYDPYFDKICGLLDDPESFDADVLTEEDWKTRFGELTNALATVNRSLIQNKRRLDWLVTNLFIAEKSSHWIRPENFVAYLEVFDKALQDGFIPDCVCIDGPSPSEIWRPSVVTPVKTLGKRFEGTSDTVQPTFVPIAVAPLGAAQPPHQTISAAFATFMEEGSAMKSQLASPANKPALLPILGIPTSRWLAPSNQPIYCLEDFAPIQTKTGKGISSRKDWRAAALSLGQAMAADPGPHNFTWTDFMTYVEVTEILFNVHPFSSVVEHDIAWRKWRRAHSESWSAFNHVLRDLYLSGGSNSSISTPKARLSQLVCFDFSRPGGGCTRLASCQYVHQCNRCHTTFPASTSTCPCVHGVLPPGTTLPPGVTYGK